MKIKYLLAIAFFTFTSAAHGQTVAEFVEFQRAKHTTYAQAVAQYEKTKKKVCVWVNHEDINVWLDTKDEYIHCFVEKFSVIDRGVVIGGEQDGIFAKLKVLPVANLTSQIRDCKCQHCACDPCKCNAVPAQTQPQPFSFQPVQVVPCVQGH